MGDAIAPQTGWVELAIERLGQDGFLAYPTETVWGLGACADRPVAIERLMAWKGRASDAPMSVLLSGIEDAERHGCRFDARARRLAETFWPGPLTLVLPCRGRFAPGVARADGALGVRCSSHPVAGGLALGVERAGLGPLTSTSLNRTGEAPARDRSEAQRCVEGGAPEGRDENDLSRPGWVDFSEGDAGGETPSSVVDCTGADLKILRAGALATESLERVWSD